VLLNQLGPEIVDIRNRIIHKCLSNNTKVNLIVSNNSIYHHKIAYIKQIKINKLITTIILTPKNKNSII